MKKSGRRKEEGFLLSTSSFVGFPPMSRSHQIGLVLLLTAFAISVLIRLS